MARTRSPAATTAARLARWAGRAVRRRVEQELSGPAQPSSGRPTRRSTKPAGPAKPAKPVAPRADRSAGRPVPGPRPGPPSARRESRPASAAPAYRGDFEGRAEIDYAPHPDGLADPGEVVWAWVPYEDDPAQGKDRPVLVIARDGDDLLGLMLTSKDHGAPGQHRADDGRTYHDLGTGDWDAQGRPSEVRLDRVLRLAPAAVRREGAVLDRARFDQVAAAVRRTLGW